MKVTAGAATRLEDGDGPVKGSRQFPQHLAQALMMRRSHLDLIILAIGRGLFAITPAQILFRQLQVHRGILGAPVGSLYGENSPETARRSHDDACNSLMPRAARCCRSLTGQSFARHPS